MTPETPKESFIPLIYLSAENVAKKLPRLLGKDDAVKITFDVPSNRIIIQANAETTQRAEKIIARLDVKVERWIEAVPLKSISAVKAAKSLKIILTLTAISDNDDRYSVFASADEKTNSILVFGPADKIRLIKEILQRLDGVDK